MQCTAKAKRTGQQCLQRAVTGFRVCNKHGAGTKKRPGGRPITSGKRTRILRELPERFQKAFQLAMHDEKWLALREEIAFIDLRIGELVKRLDSGESGQLWGNLFDLTVKLESANREKDLEEVGRLMTQIVTFIRRGQADFALWVEAADFIERRRKLIESERKWLIESEMMLDLKKGMVFVAAVLDCVQQGVSEVVEDPQQARAILIRIGGLVERLTSPLQNAGQRAIEGVERGNGSIPDLAPTP